MRELGQFADAEALLKRIVEAQPENWPAMLLLMRVYAGDLLQPNKALAFITPVDKKNPPLHPAFVKYAKRSVEEWYTAALQGKRNENRSVAAVNSTPAAPAVVMEISVDDLLKNGQLTTAIELLENTTREEPKNFDAWMKLAEVHAIYCSDLNRAGKIFRTMELSGNFTLEEIQQTRAQLREWHAARR